MGRLIDADALYAKVQEGEELARKRVLDTESTLPYPTNLNPAYTRYFAQMDERTKLKYMIADAPTVHPEPQKMGEWVERNVFWSNIHGVGELQSARCSICGRYHTTPYHYSFYEYEFCPHCGKRMKGAGNGND